MKNPTNVASFERMEPAGSLAKKLRDAGFNARVRGEVPLPQRHGAVATNVGGVFHVAVPSSEAVRAMSWCREFDAADALLSQAFRCPHCGSLRIAPAGSSVDGDGLSNDELHCMACAFSWSNSETRAPDDHHVVA
jgi:hypothetical protein